MSRNPDGTFSCDRCGTDIGNGGIDVAVSISDHDVDEHGKVVLGLIRVLHLCRVNKCNTHVLTKRALRSYLAKKEQTK